MAHQRRYEIDRVLSNNEFETFFLWREQRTYKQISCTIFQMYGSIIDYVDKSKPVLVKINARPL